MTPTSKKVGFVIPVLKNVKRTKLPMAIIQKKCILSGKISQQIF